MRSPANARRDYLWWQAQDRRVLKRVNTLLADIARNGNDAIGKPEVLKHDFADYWSRRITDEHRLVYKVVEEEVRIAACRRDGPNRCQVRRRMSRTSVIWSLRVPTSDVRVPTSVRTASRSAAISSNRLSWRPCFNSIRARIS